MARVSALNWTDEADPFERYLRRLPKARRQFVLALLSDFARELGISTSPLSIPWPQVSVAVFSRAARSIAASGDLRRTNAIRSWVLTALREEFTGGRLTPGKYKLLVAVPWTGRSRRAWPRLSTEHMNALLETCAEDPSVRGARDGALIALIRCFGLSTGEVVTMENGSLVPPNCKGAECLGAWNRWTEIRGGQPGPFLYSITRGGKVRPRAMSRWAVVQAIKHRSQQAGLGKLAPQFLRDAAILIGEAHCLGNWRKRLLAILVLIHTDFLTDFPAEVILQICDCSIAI